MEAAEKGKKCLRKLLLATQGRKRFKFYLPEANKTASFQSNCFETLFTANDTVSYDGRYLWVVCNQKRKEKKKVKKEKQDERVNGKGNGVRAAVKMSGKHAHWLHELPDVI